MKNYSVIVKVNGRSWKLSTHTALKNALKSAERWYNGAKKYQIEVSYIIQ